MCRGLRILGLGVDGFRDLENRDLGVRAWGARFGVWGLGFGGLELGA